MKNYLLPLFVVLLLALSGTAAASPAEKDLLVFDLTVLSIFPFPPEPTQHGNVLKIKGMKVGGDVTGDELTGKFSYVENVTVNMTTWEGTNQGFMTMYDIYGCRDKSIEGTIEIRFVGRIKNIDPQSLTGEIDDQPFTILKGTGGCTGIHGNGTRSIVETPGGWSVVRYTAQVHYAPR